MALRIFNRSFSGGEITPELFGRLDLSKVQEALALCMNFITLPHGPVVNRPGTEFIEEVKNSANATRLIPFSYNNTQTFAIQVGAGYFRFHTQGGTLQCGTLPSYVASTNVTISIAAPGVVTWTAHGLTANTPVSFSSTGALPPGIAPGATYYVVNPAANTFQLATAQNGAAITTSAAATVTISIASPGIINWTSHGLVAGAAVVFTTTGALPTGITAGTTYYVVNPALNTFQISANSGGAAINLSGTQSGVHTCTGTQVGTHTANFAYDLGSVTVSGGTNYYCLAPNAGQGPVQPAWSSSAAYVAGNVVSYNGFTFLCTSANTNVAPAYAIPQRGPWLAIWYAMPANGDYEIPNAYAAADLMDIHYTQSADVLTLVHPNYPILELRRYGGLTWELMPVNFSPLIAAPVGSAVTGSPTSHQYVVTAILKTRHQATHGQYRYSSSESAASVASAPVYCDLTQYGASITLSWAPTNGQPTWGIPAGYRVYKLINGIYQYLGHPTGTTFTDTYATTVNANPAVMPPTGILGSTAPGQPVATPSPSTLSSLNVIATGSGTTSYSYQVTALDASGSESYPTSAVSCTNNLFTSGYYNTINWPGVDNAARYNIYKQSYGIYGFIGQVAANTTTFVDNNITADISRTPPVAHDNQLAGAGDYPSAVAYYQQRRIFAGTANQPQNVWATRSGTEADLTYSIPSRDDNRLAFRIAGREASAIRHVVPLQDLLLLSASCEWRCSSSAGVLTPATINVQPQSYIGANNVTPVVVGNAVLYAAARGGHIRQIGYNWQVNGYQSTDSSIFAPHLFDYNTIVDMAYSRGPIPILWCVSSNGKLLGMTWLPEQQISSWHQHSTGNGDAFESICTISENNEDMLYCIVRRTINGATKRFVERLHTRQFSTVSDCHYVDCGATYSGASNKTGTYNRTGTTTVTCSVNGHGLVSGQSAWLAFSDASLGLGSLPRGQGYAATVVDANTYTITVPYSAAIVAAQAGLTGAISGANTAFDLAGNAGQTLQALSGTPNIYKTDWQGKQLQYATARTNSLTYSQAFDNAAWGKNQCTVTPNAAAAPDGTYTGATIIASTGATNTYVYQSLAGSFSGQTLTFSVYAKIGSMALNSPLILWLRDGAGTTNVAYSSFNLTNGAIVTQSLGSASTQNLGNGWYRFSVTGTMPAGLSGCTVYVDPFNGPVAGETYFLWGAQLEANGTVSSYIPTTTAAVSVTDYALTTTPSTPAHVVFASAPIPGNLLTWDGAYFSSNGTLTQLATSINGLTWLEGMTVNILADGAVMPPQTVTGGMVSFPVGVSQVHIGLPITAQLQTPPVAAATDPSMAQGLSKNLNKVFLRTYRSSGVLAGPDFADLTPYRQRTVENPGAPPNLVSDEIEILLNPDWGTSGQICIQQSDPLPLDIASMTLEIAVGGGV